MTAQAEYRRHCSRCFTPIYTTGGETCQSCRDDMEQWANACHALTRKTDATWKLVRLIRAGGAPMAASLVGCTTSTLVDAVLGEDVEAIERFPHLDAAYEALVEREKKAVFLEGEPRPQRVSLMPSERALIDELTGKGYTQPQIIKLTGFTMGQIKRHLTFG